MLALAYPALSLKIGDGALRQFPKGNETRQGAELAARAAGPGAAGPVQIVGRFDRGRFSDARNRTAVAAYVQSLRSSRAVARVMPSRASRDGRSVLLIAVPKSDPESPGARGLV